MKKQDDSEMQQTSGLFIGSEPIYAVHDRRTSDRGDDDSKDSDNGDDDSSDSDKADSDSADKSDRADDSRDSDKTD